MRISDWSSDVCSSDLNAVHASVFVNLHGLHFGFRRQNRRYFEMAYLPSGGLSELVQLRPGFLHILRTRALTECDLIVVIDRDPPVAVFADPFENRVTEPAQHRSAERRVGKESVRTSKS